MAGAHGLRETIFNEWCSSIARGEEGKQNVCDMISIVENCNVKGARCSWKDFVYCLSRPAGTRDQAVHEVEAVVQQQAQPVPHGFLAKSIHVVGPFGLQQVLPRINAKMH
eukprot:1161468-Pelagomonas_calceolata.AAC.8